MGEFYSKYIGEVYGRLTIVGVVRNPKPKFICSCSCGNETTTDVHSVLSGKTQSCRCMQKELIRENGKKNLRPAVKPGEVFRCTDGELFEIIEYINSNKVLIKFLQSGFERYSAVKEIKGGKIKDRTKYFKAGDEVVNKQGFKAVVTNRVSDGEVHIRFEDGLEGVYNTHGLRNGVFEHTGHYLKVGDKFKNTQGCDFEVIERQGYSKVKIKYLDTFGYEMFTSTDSIREGSVRNPYHPSVNSQGYKGNGDFSIHTQEGKVKREYTLWNNMINRCYDEKELIKQPTYRECWVEEHFKDYQNFGPWCSKQVGFFEKDWCLDKDVIFKGNKMYGEDTCAFVPREINNLFTLRIRKRGDCPLGVHWDNTKDKYVAQVNRHGKRDFLGYFDEPLPAFIVYKQAKEDYIKEVAEIWKDKIDPRVYASLINWTIEVTD